MKKLLLATTAVFALSTAAQAADLPAQQTYVPEAPVYASTVWSGFYAGAHVGWTRGEYHDSDYTLIIFREDVDSVDSISGGLYAGYNHQLTNSNVVLGLEADVTFYDLGSDNSLNTVFVDSTYQASLRARAGYAMDRFLPFLTAGVAMTDLDVASTVGGGSMEKTVFGYVLGAGVDYAFTQNWVGRLEYNFATFESHAFLTGSRGYKVGLDTHTVRVGLSYKF